MQQQPYTKPELVEFGRVEDLTRGPRGGWIDWFTGAGDGDGGCAGGPLVDCLPGHTSS